MGVAENVMCQVEEGVKKVSSVIEGVIHTVPDVRSVICDYYSNG